MVSLLKRAAMAATAVNAPFPEAAMDRYVELNRLKRLLETLDINCVLDVGANKGQFVEKVRGIGFRGRIVSFEPLRREFTQLSSRFRGDAQWRGVSVRARRGGEPHNVERRARADGAQFAIGIAPRTACNRNPARGSEAPG